MIEKRNEVVLDRCQAVVFDLDGTLVNSIDDLTDNVNLTLREGGFPERTLEEVKQFVGNGIWNLMERALPSGVSEEVLQKYYDIFKGYYLTNMHNRTKPYDGIIDMIKVLKERGIKTAVVSNKLDEATKTMVKHYFGDLIDVAIGDNEMREKKPAPDNVLEALRQLGKTQAEAIYMGDTKVDVATARNSGLAMVGVTWGYRGRPELIAAGADIIIDEPAEFPQVIAGV